MKAKAKTPVRPRKRKESHGEDPDLFNKSQLAELRKQIKDSRDPARYMIKSGLYEVVKRNFYYNVSDDVWTTAQAEGTLFKRIEAAEAILSLLNEDDTIIQVVAKAGKIRNIRTIARGAAC
jgi:hypothetical protein